LLTMVVFVLSLKDICLTMDCKGTRIHGSVRASIKNKATKFINFIKHHRNKNRPNSLFTYIMYTKQVNSCFIFYGLQLIELNIKSKYYRSCPVQVQKSSEKVCSKFYFSSF
jgi:hypothetical protein